MKIAALLVIVGAAGAATAGTVDVTKIDRSSLNIDSRIVAMTESFASTKSFNGDDYFVVPALGSSAGFALAGGPFVNTTFGGGPQNIGAALAGGSVFSDDSFSTDVPNNAPNGSTGTLQLDLLASTATPDLFPGGFNIGGQPATRAGHFMGANAGGNPLVNDKPVVLTFAAWFGFDATGTQVWGTDISSLIAGVSNVDGTWTGSFGVGFGSFGAGLGIVQSTLLFDYVVVPAPASTALLGLGGLAAIRRRR
ncbi:MAG: PEP-CTERM sorting domain-containing protein [Phycisphaerales bacterium]|jgi:hypothetical protein|nr:PEP-CTERM sorting domain-containing protein [Phycisphaerales bacterium]